MTSVTELQANVQAEGHSGNANVEAVIQVGVSGAPPFVARLVSLVRFGSAAGIGFVAILGTTALLHETFRFRESWAYACGLGVGLVLNFAMLRYFVFPGRAQSIAVQFGQVAASSVVFRVSEYVLFVLAVEFAGWHYAMVALVVQGGMFLVKHKYYRWLLVGRASDESTSAFA